MSCFCLLKDPQSYIAHDWDLVTEADSRNHWLDIFHSHFNEMMKHASAQWEQSASRSIAAASKAFNEILEALREDPTSLPGGDGKLNIIKLCRKREAILREYNLTDPFSHVKDLANAEAVELYPQVVRKLHAMESDSRWLHLIESVFAGNMFDLGAPSTMNLSVGALDFLSTLEKLKPRPWLVDDFDAFVADLASAPPAKWAKVVVFVDNTGSDFILGIMPLVRELALWGVSIVLAANELPSLNDITADEMVEVLQILASKDNDLVALLNAGMFEVVSTGNDIPLIDFADVSDELNEAAEDAELVIIEGMGRAIESNFDATFKVDALHLALLKDSEVASRIGGEIFDCVCKYTPSQ